VQHEGVDADFFVATETRGDLLWLTDELGAYLAATAEMGSFFAISFQRICA
jgi:hypothetical protein